MTDLDCVNSILIKLVSRYNFKKIKIKRGNNNKGFKHEINEVCQNCLSCVDGLGYVENVKYLGQNED